MADYYSLLMGSISALPSSTTETRRELYQRARQVLLRQLQSARPPRAPEEIERQLCAFDNAVAEIEVELMIGAALKTSSPPVDAAEPSVADDQQARGSPPFSPV